jgi:predicted DCC family thiol-disulfide oxidoreductase YuxK
MEVNLSAYRRPIIFFDGVCNLCNHTVKFILKHEQSSVILFSSLQSHLGREASRRLLHESKHVDSVILMVNNRLYTQSTAIHMIANYLVWPYNWIRYTRFIPRPIRELMYRLIARNRYQLFGKKSTCMIPPPEVADRFI